MAGRTCLLSGTQGLPPVLHLRQTPAAREARPLKHVVRVLFNDLPV